jgi:hypothetical protein
MTIYSNIIYGVRYGYFIDNKFTIVHECKFNSIDDKKLINFKRKYNNFNEKNDNQLFYHFFKSIDCNNDEKFFLWVGIPEEQFREFMDKICINLSNDDSIYNSDYSSYSSYEDLQSLDC